MIPFLSASTDITDPHFTISGIPYESHSSGRGGAAEAPDVIRTASDLIETYSPYMNRDLEFLRIKDAGNMDISGKFPLESVQTHSRAFFQSQSIPVFFGGNHSVTPPLIKSAAAVHPDLQVLILDAHTDLRPEYQGSKDNHACAAARMGEIIGLEHIKMFGVRSGTREEFAIVQQYDLRISLFEEELDRLRRFLEGKPVYISVDLDVFDPSIFPGTGTPEPGGITYPVFLELCRRLAGLKIVGVDLVEFSPPLDFAGISGVLAASCARELMLTASMYEPAEGN
jgi:agmatinase